MRFAGDDEGPAPTSSTKKPTDAGLVESPKNVKFSDSNSPTSPGGVLVNTSIKSSAGASPGMGGASPSSSLKDPRGGVGVGGRRKSLRLNNVNVGGGGQINPDVRLLRDRSWKTMQEAKGGASAAAAAALAAQKKLQEEANEKGGGGKKKKTRKNRGLFGALFGGGKEEVVEEEKVVEYVEYVALVPVLDEPYAWPQLCEVLGCAEGETSLHAAIDGLIFQIERDPLFEVSEWRPTKR